MTEDELRRKAIMRFTNGETAKSIYTDLGRTKQWFFKWLNRYRTGDPDWYRSKSHATHTKPNRTSDAERSRIIKIRHRLEKQRFAQFGVSAIKWELHKADVPLPSDSTIYRVLKQEGLIKKNCLRPERGGVSVFHRSALQKQHPSGRFGGPALYQRTRAVLFVQHHRCGYSPGLHRISAHPARPSDRLQPPAQLEGDRNARFSADGQCAHVQGQQSLSSLLRPGDSFMPALWRYAGIHPYRRALAQRGY